MGSVNIPEIASSVSPPQRAVAWLFAAAILHGLVFLLLLPPWMGEDEPWHFEYIHNLALSGDETVSGPEDLHAETIGTNSQWRIRARTDVTLEEAIRTQREIVDSMHRHDFWERVDFSGWEHGAFDLDHFVANHSEAQQPPLYYKISAAGIRLFELEGIDQELGFVRFLSFLSYLAVLLFTYALASHVQSDGWVPLVAMLIVAWLPMHARQAAVVSNDVLVKVFVAAALWLISACLARGGSLPLVLAIIGCTGIAMASKATAAGLAGPLCFAAAWVLGKKKGALAGWSLGLISFAITIGALISWVTAGAAPEARDSLDGLGVPVSLPQLETHLAWVFSSDFWGEGARTLGGTFNWYSRDLPAVQVAALICFLVLGLLGSLAVLVRSSAGGSRAVLVMCWIGVTSQLLAMVVRGFAAGRFFFPMLPALGTLVAVGWILLLPPRWRGVASLGVACALVLYDGFSLWNGLVPNQYLIWGS